MGGFERLPEVPPHGTADEFPTHRPSTRKLSAQRQISAAIRHFINGDLECAITLAAAAEGQLPNTADPYLLKGLARVVPFAEFNHNMVINWLKHHIEPNEVNIPRYEAIMVISRSISKFVAVYWEISRLMDLFLKVHHDPIFRGKDDNAGCGRPSHDRTFSVTRRDSRTRTD
jgi:hypothetical protein